MNLNVIRSEYNSKYVSLSSENYLKLGVQYPENVIKNLSIDQSPSMSNELKNWIQNYSVSMTQIKTSHPDLHDSVVISKSDKLIKTLYERYRDCIKEIVKEGEALANVYKDMAKDYEKRINEIGQSVKNALADGFSYDPLKVDFEKDLSTQIDFDFEPKKNLLISLYKNTFKIDISKLDNKALKALYDINHDFNPSFERLIPLGKDLQAIHNFYSKQLQELTKDLKRIELSLNEIKNPIEKFSLSRDFMAIKKQHIEIETIIKSTVVLYRGLEVVAGTEFKEGSFKLNYDINKSGELVSAKSSTQDVSEIQ